MSVHVLVLEPRLKRDLWAHLLPPDTLLEQAAFLFCVSSVIGERTKFEVVDSAFLVAADFAMQGTDYLELSDPTRVGLIKRAHALNAALVELHSHPGPCPAAFSPSDRRGLRETVPHMRWRLKCRPYLAIVVAPSSFDALVWLHDPRIPEPLEGIEVDDNLMTPTNASLRDWDDG